MVNPAFMNENNTITAYLSGRNHWSSMNGSPMDLYFGLNYPFMDNTAAGIKIMADQQGFFNTTLSELTYSYKQKINADHTIFFGMSAGLETFRLNTADIITGTLADPALDEEKYNDNRFSAGMGIYYTYRDLFLSASLPRLIEHEMMHQTFHGSVGYDLLVKGDESNQVLSFEPSVTINSIPVSPIQYDINLVTKIHESFYIQTSYITNQSFVTGLGVQYSDAYLGYSYEFSMGNLSNMSSGSHEVMLSYRFKDAGSFFKKLFEKKQEEEEMQRNVFAEKYRAKEDQSYDYFYVVVGAYYELKDAIEFRDVLRSELQIDTEIMERGDGKYYFVYTEQVKEREEALQRINELNNSELKKYIRGNVWMYGEQNQKNE